jgi:hypothetical protein
MWWRPCSPVSDCASGGVAETPTASPLHWCMGVFPHQCVRQAEPSIASSKVLAVQSLHVLQMELEVLADSHGQHRSSILATLSMPHRDLPPWSRCAGRRDVLAAPRGRTGRIQEDGQENGSEWGAASKPSDLRRVFPAHPIPSLSIGTQPIPLAPQPNVEKRVWSSRSERDKMR